jgi:hypothetical protein
MICGLILVNVRTVLWWYCSTFVVRYCLISVYLGAVLCCILFFLWSLCCLFFFDIRIMIPPLVSSNSSYYHDNKMYNITMTTRCIMSEALVDGIILMKQKKEICQIYSLDPHPLFTRRLTLPFLHLWSMIEWYDYLWLK